MSRIRVMILTMICALIVCQVAQGIVLRRTWRPLIGAWAFKRGIGLLADPERCGCALRYACPLRRILTCFVFVFAYASVRQRGGVGTRGAVPLLIACAS